MVGLCREHGRRGEEILGVLVGDLHRERLHLAEGERRELALCEVLLEAVDGALDLVVRAVDGRVGPDEPHPTAEQQRELYDWLVAHGDQVLTGDSFFHLSAS